jgi:hypothetical protein
MDRGGLTKTGRALDKHAGRSGSAFPRIAGNPVSKNIQGQYHLEDILTHSQSKIIKDGSRGFEIYAPDGRDAYFKNDGFEITMDDNFRIRLCSDVGYEEMVAD